MERKLRIHRVGTLTFGCVQIVFGVLFLMHIFVPALSYEVIFRLWPLILIILGIEVLVENYRIERMKTREEETRIQFQYDKASIILMICLTLFAMMMAAVDVCMQYQCVSF